MGGILTRSTPEGSADYIGALRCGVSAGAGRSQDKAEMLWVPSRHQLADGLTKKNLGGPPEDDHADRRDKVARAE